MYWGDMINTSTTDISQLSSYSTAWEGLQVKKQSSSYMLEWIIIVYRKLCIQMQFYNLRHLAVCLNT